MRFARIKLESLVVMAYQDEAVYIVLSYEIESGLILYFSLLEFGRGIIPPENCTNHFVFSSL